MYCVYALNTQIFIFRVYCWFVCWFHVQKVWFVSEHVYVCFRVTYCEFFTASYCEHACWCVYLYSGNEVESLTALLWVFILFIIWTLSNEVPFIIAVVICLISQSYLFWFILFSRFTVWFCRFLTFILVVFWFIWTFVLLIRVLLSVQCVYECFLIVCDLVELLLKIGEQVFDIRHSSLVVELLTHICCI